MPELNFPSSPTEGELLTANERTWRWKSATLRWELAGRTFNYKITTPEIQGYGGSSQNRLTLRSDSTVYIELRATDDDANPGRVQISAYGGVLSLPGFSGNFTWAGNVIWHAGNDGAGSGLDADTVDSLEVHTGRNSNANQIVRTNASGYLDVGYINSNVGADASAASYYWFTGYGGDGYLRPKALADVKDELTPESTWTPAFQAFAGSPSTVFTPTLTHAKYHEVNGYIHWSLDFTFTSAAGAGDFCVVTMPFNIDATAGAYCGYGRDMTNGVMLMTTIFDAQKIVITTYNNGGVVANGVRLNVQGFYKKA